MLLQLSMPDNKFYILTNFGEVVEWRNKTILMNTKYLVLFIFLITISLLGCSKKTVPVTTTTAVENTTVEAPKKVVTKKKVSEPVPKVISVNDLSAKKTVDGRLYYDLEGHRYWRNKKDGKYYLYNKKMYANDAFKPD